jgi:sugar/nucleoside kinase (ribokinase family)
VIVILGRPEVVVASDPDDGATDGVAPDLAIGGLAAGVALAVAASGVHVELVGSIGDDVEGDAVALALGQAGVGHAALLRDPAARTPRRSADGALLTEAGSLPRLDAGDVGLGLRYVPACHVLVLATPLESAAWAAAMEGAAYHGASVIAVVGSADEVTEELTGALVLIAPDPDDRADGADEEHADPSSFEAFVAGCAVRIARGVAPEVALAEAVAAGAWEPSGD